MKFSRFTKAFFLATSLVVFSGFSFAHDAEHHEHPHERGGIFTSDGSIKFLDLQGNISEIGATLSFNLDTHSDLSLTLADHPAIKASQSWVGEKHGAGKKFAMIFSAKEYDYALCGMYMRGKNEAMYWGNVYRLPKNSELTDSQLSMVDNGDHEVLGGFLFQKEVDHECTCDHQGHGEQGGETGNGGGIGGDQGANQP